RTGRVKEAILCCWGILSNGAKVLIHMDVASCESYSVWKAFLTDLVNRGLPSPLTVTTDGAAGLTRAVEEVWGEAIRIRCWAHKMRNILDKIPAEAHGEVKAFLSCIRDAPDWATGRQLANQFVKQYRHEYGRAIASFEDDFGSITGPSPAAGHPSQGGADHQSPGAGIRRGAAADKGDSPLHEEHTSELQSRENIVCRLLLEKKNLIQRNQYAGLRSDKRRPSHETKSNI